MLHATTTLSGSLVGPDGSWITESRIPVDTSVWLGIYKAVGGRIITVKFADSNGIAVTFASYSEEGNYKQEYTLLFVDAEKRLATYNELQFHQRDVYSGIADFSHFD